ncbi:hypothetical protein [Pseudomonas chlororaphis]|uniref:hypothetical protein n=1 Tax=Pseudomonas chlororaphis TaxID=587753 RepID=UPI002366DB42|nr:hypothetical protein [Pseudomonas chlororaphis]WDH25128.1 hypothetical protein PUP50_12920 [Pseudomonas chlororaphis]
MPWYKSGTVSVTQNSNAVIGTGTAFIANSRVGDGFRGPDGGWYEVTNIASDTAISIDPPYQGATNAAGIYALAPLEGYVKESADQLRAIVNTFGAKLAALGTTGNYEVLPVTKGGTGATDVVGARAALQVGPRRNLIMNPLFNINQRLYGAEATTAAGQYTFDRWRVVTSGQSLPSQANKNGRIVIPPAGGIEQVIEGSFINGGTYTLSWEGTATATINNTAITNGAQITLVAGSNTTIKFTGGYLFYPKLELGSVPTGYEDRSYGEELILCQRYYEKSYPFDARPGSTSGVASPNASNGMTLSCSGSGTRAMGRSKFSVEKRAVPTVRYWDQNMAISCFSAGNSDGTIQTNGFNSDPFRIVLASTAYIWAHCARFAGDTFFCHWEASAEL